MEQTNTKKVVLITGAARNTGFGIARRFAREGYAVCITSRFQEKADAAAERIRAEYPNATVCGYGMETAQVAQIRAAFAAVKQTFGRLDVFVSNATDPGYRQSILSTTPEQYDYVMNSNARGYFFCCQEAGKIMKEQSSGAIVLIGSVHSKGALPERIVYASSKGAIDVMNRNICYELGKYGVRCNLIVAGAVYNDRWEGMTEQDYANRRKNWPLGKESYPDDIANAAYFLASDEARTITGAELRVDSGVMSCMLTYNSHWDE